MPATVESLDAKLDILLERQERIERHLEEQNGRLREAETCIARLQERQTLWHAAQTALTIGLSSVAAWLGVQK